MSKLLAAAFGDYLYKDTTNDFPRTHTRMADPDTSYNAAVVASYRARSHKARILEAMHDQPDMQFEEIALHAGLKDSQVWKRLPDLERDGHILALAETRLLSSGSEGRLWRLKAPE